MKGRQNIELIKFIWYNKKVKLFYNWQLKYFKEDFIMVKEKWQKKKNEIRRNLGDFIAIFEGNDGKYYSEYHPNKDKAHLTDLEYDSRTRVIYYVVYNGKKLAFRHPYINENGKYCRFINGNFVEIP